MKTNFQQEFEKHLNKFATSPYLFIGSGLSSRYINTEGWGLLLENICKELNLEKNFYYDGEIYKKFFEGKEFKELFENFKILSLEEKHMDRYEKPKTLWEFCIKKQ